MTKYLSLCCLIMALTWVDTCDEICGKSKYSDAGEVDPPPEAEIVGGIEARPNEFPWMVSLRRVSDEDHFCGGMIVTKSWIMTAAHCIIGKKPSDVLVVVGEHEINATSDIRESHKVGKFIIHEEYYCGAQNNDIALIKVTPIINFNVNVSPVCIPKTDDDCYVNRKSLVSGWGLLFESDDYCNPKQDLPEVLMYTTLNITTNEFCQERNCASLITENMMCAIDNTGGNNSDACQGDSGGPLTVKDRNNVFSVVGIVSFGNGCASGNPGVYTRVSRFINWINDKISSE